MIEVTLETAAIVDGEMDVVARVRVRSAMPAQNERLPHEVEKITIAAGQQFMRSYYDATMELADRELILSMRGGQRGSGIRLMGKRGYTFITPFGRVPMKRTRIQHKADGNTEIPAGRIWRTPKQRMITQGLKNAICDIVSKQSYSNTVAELERETGEQKVISKTTVGNILKREGARLTEAQSARATEIIIKGAAAAQQLLGRAESYIGEEYFEAI